MWKASVLPAVQPVVVKSNKPCGNAMPAGAEPAGGLPASPATWTNLAVPKAHVGPPPLKLTETVPVPVAEGAENVVTAAAGVTVAGAEAGPVPTLFVAATVHE